MLVLLAPEKYQVKKMNTYLAPMIDELQLLYNEIKLSGVSRPLNAHDREFTICQILC